MPGIQATISKQDLDFLNRTARIWGVVISQHDVSTARDDLLKQMTQQANLEKVILYLSAPSRTAWEELLANHGRIAWAIFSRKYGEIRDFGPARREREKPDQNPTSATETLWYSGLIGRAFLKVGGELIEMAYIPDEILNLTAFPKKEIEQQVIRPAVNQKPRHIDQADSFILDHITDMLAAARMMRRLSADVFTAWKIPQVFLVSLLSSAGLLDGAGLPVPEVVKTFLQQDRAASLQSLFQTWILSQEINELRMLPGLLFEGSWMNDPIQPRKLLLDMLSALQPQTWWSISSIISTIKNQTPDFQRPAGDYNSWFIREAGSSQYLSGFEYWDAVEGRLLYFLLTGPLHWFGLVNLAGVDSAGRYTTLQLDQAGLPMLRGELPVLKTGDDKEIIVKDDPAIVIPVNASRELRYQVGRFCELLKTGNDESWYRFTPASLHEASSQGLHINQLMQLLERYHSTSIPASIKVMTRRWEENGLEAEIMNGVLLKFSTEAACTDFIKASKSSRYIIEVLNSTTILIDQDKIEAVRRSLALYGILAQIVADV